MKAHTQYAKQIACNKSFYFPAHPSWHAYPIVTNTQKIPENSLVGTYSVHVHHCMHIQLDNFTYGYYIAYTSDFVLCRRWRIIDGKKWRHKQTVHSSTKGVMWSLSAVWHHHFYLAAAAAEVSQLLADSRRGRLQVQMACLRRQTLEMMSWWEVELVVQNPTTLSVVCQWNLIPHSLPAASRLVKQEERERD